jgi:hypothetical protein
VIATTGRGHQIRVDFTPDDATYPASDSIVVIHGRLYGIGKACHALPDSDPAQSGEIASFFRSLPALVLFSDNSKPR